ncbi:hypothetical protein MMYC01_201077 [Madurella mycetomatis]|uniref:Uncharacterized protein n=1 Tax=Madurella mycetomatis TaxID=100816 RepID=A0A175WG48_9PEZI|nr:hypothetical protein MMYC01_201077 [Madurella mycetomatis]
MENRVPLRPSSGSLPDHCFWGCDACNAETCAICRSRRCLLCVFLNADGAEIQTVGGKNLLPDRFEPAGWRCCCGGEHFLEPDGGHGPDTHLRVRDAAIIGSSYDIRHICQREEHNHHPCFICRVVNRYGEPIGWVGDGGPFLPNGPLSNHLSWCEENIQFIHRAAALHYPLVLDANLKWCWSEYDEAIASHYRIGSAIDQAKRLRIVEAENDLAEVEKTVKNIVAWATGLWNAVLTIKQRRLTALLR